MARWWPIVLVGLLGLGSLPASAQQGFEVLIDTNSRLIGCDVPTLDGVFEGAEHIVTVTTSADGSQITALSIRSCNPFDDTFGAPQALPGPPLPIGQGLGTGGSSVLEFAVDAARLGNPVAVRLGLVSLDGGSPQDALLTHDGQPGGDALTVILIPPTSIPTLTPWSLALLVVLLGVGLWLGRRLRRHPLMLSLLISGLLIGVAWAIELDGDPADWAGIDPLGTDPVGDGIPDIRAFFGTRSNGDLALRIDAVLNQPPQAQDDAFTTGEDTVLNGDVLADNGNGADSDPDSDPLTVIAVNGATGDVGTEITLGSGALLTVNADGNFVYDPNGAFDGLQVGDDPGEDSFTYTLGDGRGGTDTATVTITITPVNTPPSPQDDDFTVAEGGTLDDNVRTNDSDPDNAPTDLAVTTTPVSGPSHATAFTLNGDGSFSYTHDGSETTSDGFDYQICDPEPLCATATVTITVTPVNDAPVLDFPTAGTVNYDPFTDVPVILDPAATVTDVDSPDFDGGVLTAIIPQAANCNDNDRIGVNDQGIGTDQISVSGTDVGFGDPAVLIGTIATEFDCTTADPLLTVTLTADATLPAVQALLQNLNFSTTDDTGTDPRTVEVTVSDGDGGTSNTVSREVTLDEAPRLDSSSPADGVDSVALGSNIELTFSESVAFSGASTTVDCGGNVPFTVSGSPGTVITLDPDSDLPGGASCTVDVAAADVTDTDAIDPPDNPVQDESFGFITVDEPPVVDTVVPADGADPVAGDTNVTLTFSEEVTVTGNWAEVSCTSSGTRDVNAGLSVTDNNPTFILDPATNFAAGETCTVTVFAAQVSDTDGIPPAGMASDFMSTFTIDAAPEITATSPTDGATDVEPNAVVIIDFSEAVTVPGGAISVSCDGSVQSFTLGTPDADTVTLTPTSTWAPGTACIVTLTAASITDTDAVDPPDQLIGTTSFGFGVKPVADADGPFAVTGNIQIAIAASGVYDGDQRGIDTLATVNSFDANSSQGGNVNVNVDGSFTYNPPAGFAGNDSFTYTISNTNGTSDPATVSLTVSDRVWFIDNSQGCPGDGRFTDPFCTIANFNSATTFSGDYITLHQGTGTYSEADGINLGNNQVLIGNAVQFDTVFSASTNSIQAYKTFAAGTATAPTIAVTSSGNHGVQLAQNNTVRGLNVGDTTGAGAGMFGNTVGTVTVSNIAVIGQGIGVNITNGTLVASFDNISSSNNAGILLNNVSGDFDATTGAINAGGNTAVSIVGNPAVDLGVTLTSVSVNGAANGIVLTNTTGTSGGFTVTGDGALSSGLLVRNGSGGTIQNTTNDGVFLTNANNVVLRQMDILNVGNTANPADIANTANDHAVESRGGGNITLSAVHIQDPIGTGWEAFDITGGNGIDNDSLVEELDRTSNFNGLRVTNNNVNFGSVSILDSTFDHADPTPNDAANNGNAMVVVSMRGSAGGTFNVDGSLFTGARGTAITVNSGDTAGSTGTLSSNIENSTFEIAHLINGQNNIGMQAIQATTHNKLADGNTLRDVGRGGSLSGQIIMQKSDTAIMDAEANNNVISEVPNQHGLDALSLSTSTGGRVDWEADTNTIFDVGRRGIFNSARGNEPDMDVAMRNNTVGRDTDGVVDPVGFDSTVQRGVEIDVQTAAFLQGIMSNNEVIANTSGSVTGGLASAVMFVNVEEFPSGTAIAHVTFDNNVFTNQNNTGSPNVLARTRDSGLTHALDFNATVANGMSSTVLLEEFTGSTVTVEDLATVAGDNPGVGTFNIGAGITDHGGNVPEPDF